ncbi:YolD-like family protein [Aureibacillus halotolerans]|uniref:YolD-like protein n=1 Tax=Aureibacillus halotolerans TaxID=1508390 RepID=A0A4R6U490_9BACI|nr:YolD-like family protein [Aureibacillus halotolerans]TDQ39255.1 YolD-like protein [Aureibacillus halotolerans]
MAKRDPREYANFGHILWDKNFILPEQRNDLRKHYNEVRRQPRPNIVDELAQEHYELLRHAAKEKYVLHARHWTAEDGQYHEVTGVPKNICDTFMTVDIDHTYVTISYITHLTKV